MSWMGSGEVTTRLDPCACEDCIAAMVRGECNIDDHCWCGPEVVTMAECAAQIIVHRDPGKEAA